MGTGLALAIERNPLRGLMEMETGLALAFIGEAGKLRLLSQGGLRILRRCKFYWRSWEASPPTVGIPQGVLRRMRRCDFFSVAFTIQYVYGERYIFSSFACMRNI